MVREFSVKTGNHVLGSKETVSKGERQLKRIIENII